MAKCPKCGAKVDSDDEFCPDCGAKIQKEKEFKEAKQAKELKELKLAKASATANLPISFRIIMYVVLLFLFAIMLRMCTPLFAFPGMMPPIGIVLVMVIAMLAIVFILLKLGKKQQ